MKALKRGFWWWVVGVVCLVAGYIWVVVPLVQGLTCPETIILSPSEYARFADNHPEVAVGNDTDGQKSITIKLFGFLPIKQVMVDVLPFDQVYVGGLPVGICGEIDGILVTAPSADGQLKTGDIITAVDAIRVTDADSWAKQTAGKTTAHLTFTRNARQFTKNVALTTPLATRTTTSGIGTLTLINPENHRYTALGHQMRDWETGAPVDLSGGQLRAVSVVGVTKSQAQKPGILETTIQQTAPVEGSITGGTAYGVTGCLAADSTLAARLTDVVPVATRYQVHPGRAVLRASLDGETVEEFSCEILKTRYQAQRSDKSMVIRITDKRLLDATGGIIHGLSGSPILQDGHLVGALTHAMKHDPSKGYAIYVDFLAV